MKGRHNLIAAATITALAVCTSSQILREFRFTRPISVPLSGWVKVPLDPVTRGHMTPDGRDLRLYAPSGEEIAYQILNLPVSKGPLQARATAVLQAPGGWYLDFDLGPQVTAHSAFRFEFSNHVAAQGCSLLSSANRAAWKPLAAGDLFRLGEAKDLAETVLAYAPSRDRYLRLWWPKEAGFPDVRNAFASPAGLPVEPPQRLGLQFISDEKSAGTNGYLITLPGPGVPLRGLDLRWSGPEAAAYRLYVAGEGVWNVIAEGALAKSENGAARVTLSVDRALEGKLKLELSSGTAHPPVLEEVFGEFEPQWLLFAARQSGLYLLAYGNAGLAPPRYPAAAPIVSLGSMALISPGPEKEQPLPRVSAQTTGLGAPIPKQPFQASWPVQSGGASPGQLVRLEIPGEVYDIAQPSLGDLRLSCDGRQVPYVLCSPPSPALVAALRGVAPAPKGSGESEIALKLPQKSLPLSSIEMFSKASAFERSVEVRGQQADARPGMEDRASATLAYGDFVCPGQGELPCRLGLCLYGARGLSGLRVTFSDGDNPPLPLVDVFVWRRRHLLLFFLPAGEVRLLAGAQSLGQPLYDLAALQEQLLYLPAAAVTLGRPQGTEGAMEQGTAKWALAAILAIAGLVLAVLLARLIRHSPQS